MTKTSVEIGFRKEVEACLEQNLAFCLLKFPGSEKPIFFYGSGNSIPTDRDYIIVQEWEGQQQYIYAELEKRDFVESCIKTIPPSETTFDEYAAQYKQYLNAFENSPLRKAILSRIKNISRPESFEPYSAFEALCNNRNDACVYILNHPSAGVWMGASPEILLSKNGKIAQTVSLAGTQKKTTPPYVWEEKEREEQGLVSEHIRNVIGNLGQSIQSEKGPFTAEAGNVAHLKTEFTFVSNSKLAPLSIVEKLHPTPAIAGLPVGLALDLIQKEERHKRQLYTGFIGFINSEKDVDIYVNLRCMQIHKNQISLYVGGGITSKSNLDLEWNETEEKAKTLLKVINE